MKKKVIGKVMAFIIMTAMVLSCAACDLSTGSGGGGFTEVVENVFNGVTDVVDTVVGGGETGNIGGGGGGGSTGTTSNPPKPEKILDDTLVCEFLIPYTEKDLHFFEEYAGVNCQFTNHYAYFLDTLSFDHIDWGDGCVQWSSDSPDASEHSGELIGDNVETVEWDGHTDNYIYHKYEFSNDPRYASGLPDRVYTCHIYGVGAEIGGSFDNSYNLQTFRIPDNCTSISFNGCLKLVTVNFGDDCALTTFPSFGNCPLLHNVMPDNYPNFPDGYVTFPSGITSGNVIFTKCNGVQAIYIPSSVTTVRLAISHLINLKKIEFGSGLTSFSSSLNLIDECYLLDNVYFHSEVAPTLNAALFGETNDGGHITLHVPSSGLMNYLTASNYPTDRIVGDL